MKALSIQQPWAQLILGNAPASPIHQGKGVKDVENRSWPCDYRGVIVVHAGKRFDKDTGAADGQEEYFHLGALLGFVEIVGCRRDSKSPWAVAGQWHWELARPVCFVAPMPWKGALGLFDVPGSVVLREFSGMGEKLRRADALVEQGMDRAPAEFCAGVRVLWPPRIIEPKAPRKKPAKKVQAGRPVQDEFPGMGPTHVER